MSNDQNNNSKTNNISFNTDNVKTSNTSNIPENPDEDIEYKKEERKRKNELEDLKHQITKNIYDFLVVLTKKPVLIILFLIVFFIIYPLSILDNIPFIKNIESRTFIKQYCSHLFNILKPIGSFIVGIIISDWASSKLKK